MAIYFLDCFDSLRESRNDGERVDYFVVASPLPRNDEVERESRNNGKQSASVFG